MSFEELVILDLQFLFGELDFGSEILFDLSYLVFMCLLEFDALVLQVFTNLGTILLRLYLNVFLDELFVGQQFEFLLLVQLDSVVAQLFILLGLQLYSDIG